MLKRKLNIENQLYLFQIFGIVVTAALCLVLTISVTLDRSSRQQEEALLKSVPRWHGPKMWWRRSGRAAANISATI